jgi:hypothetical protein
MIPSGANLASMSQKDFYFGIKKANRPTPRRSTETNLGRIQACAEATYEITPTTETIWKSTRHKDLTKRTQEFLWKNIHDAFKIGKFWPSLRTEACAPTVTPKNRWNTYSPNAQPQEEP